MLLRTRITGIAAAGLLLSALCLLGGSLLHEQLLRQRLAASAQSAQAALWAEALAAEDRALDESIDKLLLVPQFQSGVRLGERDALDVAMAGEGLLPGPHQPLALVDLLGMGSAPMLWGQTLDSPLLDADSLERASVGDAVDGLHLVGSSKVLVLSTRRLAGQGDAAVLVLARDARHALAQMAQRSGAAVALLDLHGRLLRTTDAALWQAAAPHVAPRGAQYAELELNARSYTISSMPVNDLAGHAAGTLVTLTDTPRTPRPAASWSAWRWGAPRR